MSLIESLEGRQHFYFGSITAAFGTAGVATVPSIGVSDYGFAETVVQSDGKTVIGAGGGLSRLLANGTLDTTFGTNGVTAVKGIGYRDHALDSSGRTYLLASNASGTLVLRYGTNGRLDTGFGTNGIVVAEASQAFQPKIIELQSDGKIVIAGAYRNDTTGLTTRVYRLTAAGAKDTGFGTGGVASFSMAATDPITPKANDIVADLKVLPNGKIVVLGSSYNYFPEGYNQNTGDYEDPVIGNSVSALVRLTSGGSLDTSLGAGGIARRVTFDDASVNATAGVIKADGSAVIATSGDADDDRTVFLGLNSSGKTAFNPYAADITRGEAPTDATTLSDSRTAFVNASGAAWTVSGTGSISNLVTPLVSAGGTFAIAGTASDDLRVAGVNRNTLAINVVAFDAGRASDPRPDNLPAAGAVDTAVDAQGGLHVAYFDVASKSLKYAYRNAQGYWGGIRTVDATLGAGAAISIDTTQIKDRTNVAIAYYDSSTADLRIAASRTNGRAFSLSTIASKGAVGISPSLHFTDTGGYAVSYYSKTTASLYYALNNGNGWASEVVDTNAGEWSEMMFDPTTRKPAIAYSKADKTVWYAFKGAGSTWADARVKVATTTGGAAFVNVAIPADIYYGPKVSYYDLASADLVVASFDRYAEAGKKWSTQTIASRGAVGAWNELTDDNYGAFTAYAYARNGDTVFKYTGDTVAGGAITATPLATGGGKYLSVANDVNDNLAAIAYADTATGLLFVR